MLDYDCSLVMVFSFNKILFMHCFWISHIKNKVYSIVSHVIRSFNYFIGKNVHSFLVNFQVKFMLVSKFVEHNFVVCLQVISKYVYYARKLGALMCYSSWTAHSGSEKETTLFKNQQSSHLTFYLSPLISFSYHGKCEVYMYLCSFLYS